jgi:hypothetical protein
MTSIFSPSFSPIDDRREVAPIVTASRGIDRPLADLPDLADHRPSIDEDGLLWFDDRWVALTELQVPVVGLLIDRLGVMVSASELAVPYAAAGGSDDPAALRSLMFRVAQQLASVGLAVTFARRRAGMLVTAPADDHPLR